MFCPGCGAKNDLERSTCFVCGKGLPSAGTAAAAPAPSISRRRPPQQPQPASGAVGDRMLALLFDRLLLASLALIAVAYLASVWWTSGAPLSATALAILGTLSFALVAFAYHTVAEGFAGATLGKAIFGLSVRNEGERGRLAAAAIRNALRVADGLGGYAVGFLVALFARRHRRVGDLVAGTVVLSSPVPTAARAALLLAFAALVTIAIWLAWQLCPECAAALAERM